MCQGKKLDNTEKQKPLESKFIKRHPIKTDKQRTLLLYQINKKRQANHHLLKFPSS